MMVKYITLFSFQLICLISFSQELDYNSQSGYVAEGYDVVEYFNNKAVEGKDNYASTYEGAKYKFANPGNLAKFKSAPEKYIPQYGGWCAYAMGNSAEKVTINPTTFEIRDGKLYLFYNAFFTNTLKSWLEEGPEELRKKADSNWGKLRYQK
jgi:YHS domain-containing protein